MPVISAKLRRCEDACKAKDEKIQLISRGKESGNEFI